MEKEQIIGLLNTVNVAYPQFTRNMTQEERKAQLILWYEMFRYDDARVVGEAIRRHILLEKFPPSIAEIRTNIREQTLPSPSELYDTLLDKGKKSIRDELVAIEGDTYKVKSLKTEAFDELPAELKEYVKTPDGLRNWYRDWKFDHETARNKFLREIQRSREEMEIRKIIPAERRLK